MIRGTSHEQDSRFKDKAQKMLLESKWPEKYDIKIDLSKIDFEALRPWIEKRTNELLGQQDDIVSGTVVSLLEESLSKQQKPNAKKIHIAMSGFLTNHTLIFVSQLWDWLEQAQKSKFGIPKKMLESAKDEQTQRKQKLRQLGDRKNKINNYKFDSIAQHVDKSRQRSIKKKKKKKLKKYEKQRSSEKNNRKSQDFRERSYSRDPKKRKRKEQRNDSQQKSRRQRHRINEEFNRKKDKYRSSVSNKQSDSSRSRSRKRHKQKYYIRNRNSQSQSPIRHTNEYKMERSRKRKLSSPKERKVLQRSQSSEVVSSSSNN